MDNNQIMHLYRMSMGQSKTGTKPIDATLDSMIRVNQMLAADKIAFNDRKKNLAVTASQYTNGGPVLNSRANFANGAPTQPPRSANSAHHHNNLNQASAGGQTHQSSSKRESFNFVSHQSY